MSWATALLVLSAIPLLLVFVDNVLSMPTVAPSAGFPAHSDSVYSDPVYSDGVILLLNIGYLMLVVSVLNGRRRIRRTITVVTALFHLYLLVIIADPGLHLGLASEPGKGVVSVAPLVFVWTVILSGIGLVLLHTPASNSYIARSEAYQVHVDQQNTSRTQR